MARSAIYGKTVPTQPQGLQTLRLDPALVKRLQTLVYAAVALVLIGSVLGHIGNFGFGWRVYAPFRFYNFMFDLSEEANLAAWFSSMLLGQCSLILLTIGASEDPEIRPWRWHWYFIAVVFVYLSLDEATALHERATKPMHNALDLPPIFTNAWVLLALPIIALTGLLLLSFLRNLPARTLRLFVISGVIYVGGAAGVELFSGLMKYEFGTQDIRFAAVAWIEETMELAGITLFLKAASDQLIETYSRSEGSHI